MVWDRSDSSCLIEVNSEGLHWIGVLGHLGKSSALREHGRVHWLLGLLERSVDPLNRLSFLLRRIHPSILNNFRSPLSELWLVSIAESCRLFCVSSSRYTTRIRSLHIVSWFSMQFTSLALSTNIPRSLIRKSNLLQAKLLNLLAVVFAVDQRWLLIAVNFLLTVQILVKFADAVGADDFFVVCTAWGKYIELIGIFVLDKVVHDVFRSNDFTFRCAIIWRLTSLRTNYVLILLHDLTTSGITARLSFFDRIELLNIDLVNWAIKFKRALSKVLNAARTLNFIHHFAQFNLLVSNLFFETLSCLICLFYFIRFLLLLISKTLL